MKLDKPNIMRIYRETLFIISLILLAFFFITGNGEAFHTQSFSECPECHTGNGDSFKLVKTDPGSTCLRCHQAPDTVKTPGGPYVATPYTNLGKGSAPIQLSPGGDFGYLRKDYSCKSASAVVVSPGDHHGHNIVAVDYGYAADGTNTTAPGDDYSSSNLTCISCHDPHGIISTVTATGYTGSYRMLAGANYAPKLLPGVKAFKFNPPIVVSPSEYNRSESSTGTRVAYGMGMSEWCRNCHANVTGHKSGNTLRLTQDIANNYNMYIKTNELKGTRDTSYSTLVPFEEGTNDVSILVSHANINGSYMKGPDTFSNVMCLTCHRAHASAFNSMLRWDIESKYIVYQGVYPGTDNQSPEACGRTSEELQKAYYDRPASTFAYNRKSLCNKCHVRD